MKIAFISRTLFLSGVTTHIRDLAKELIKAGHSVHILTAGPQFKNHSGMDLLMKSLLETGVKIINVNYPNGNSKWEYAKLPTNIYSTYKILKKEKFDIIHVHTPILSFIPKILGYKFVTTIHVAKMELGVFHQPPTHQIAISREIYEESLANGIKKENCTIVFNGVDEKYTQCISNEEKIEIKKKYDFPSDKVLIGFVGTLCYRKGLDLLIKAYSLLNEDTKKKCMLIFCGNYDQESEKKWLEKIIEETNIKDGLKILEYQSPEYLYKIFDIFVLASRLEGFALVTIEAMLSGCCNIRSKVEGATDQIADGETGFLFESGDVQALRNILEKLINDKELRERVAIQGKMFAEENFTSKIMAKKTLEVYNKVIHEY